MGRKKYVHREVDYDGVVEYISEYKRLCDGNSPTIREIAEHLGGKSTAHVNFILDDLEAAGKIRREFRPGTKYRTLLCVPGGRWQLEKTKSDICLCE